MSFAAKYFGEETKTSVPKLTAPLSTEICSSDGFPVIIIPNAGRVLSMDAKKFMQLLEEKQKRVLAKKEAPLKWEQKLEAAAAICKGDTEAKERISKVSKRKRRSVSISDSDSDSDTDGESHERRRKRTKKSHKKQKKHNHYDSGDHEKRKDKKSRRKLKRSSFGSDVSSDEYDSDLEEVRKKRRHKRPRNFSSTDYGTCDISSSEDDDPVRKRSHSRHHKHHRRTNSSLTDSSSNDDAVHKSSHAKHHKQHKHLHSKHQLSHNHYNSSDSDGHRHSRRSKSVDISCVDYNDGKSRLERQNNCSRHAHQHHRNGHSHLDETPPDNNEAPLQLNLNGKHLENGSGEANLSGHANACPPIG